VVYSTVLQRRVWQNNLTKGPVSPYGAHTVPCGTVLHAAQGRVGEAGAGRKGRSELGVAAVEHTPRTVWEQPQRNRPYMVAVTIEQARMGVVQANRPYGCSCRVTDTACMGAAAAKQIHSLGGRSHRISVRYAFYPWIATVIQG
jgi:hypothetical protein